MQQRCSNVLRQGIFEGADGVLLHGGENVTVGVQGDGYRGVPQHLGDDLGVDVPAQEQRRAGVSEVVEAGIGGESGALEEPDEGAISEIGGVDDAAVLVCEDESSGLIKGAHILYFFKLAD